jgi:hypothetical protein
MRHLYDTFGLWSLEEAAEIDQAQAWCRANPELVERASL